MIKYSYERKKTSLRLQDKAVHRKNWIHRRVGEVVTNEAFDLDCEALEERCLMRMVKKNPDPHNYAKRIPRLPQFQLTFLDQLIVPHICAELILSVLHETRQRCEFYGVTDQV